MGSRSRSAVSPLKSANRSVGEIADRRKGRRIAADNIKVPSPDAYEQHDRGCPSFVRLGVVGATLFYSVSGRAGAPMEPISSPSGAAISRQLPNISMATKLLVANPTSLPRSGRPQSGRRQGGRHCEGLLSFRRDCGPNDICRAHARPLGPNRVCAAALETRCNDWPAETRASAKRPSKAHGRRCTQGRTGSPRSSKFLAESANRANADRFRPENSFASGGSLRSGLPGPVRFSSGEAINLSDNP